MALDLRQAQLEKYWAKDKNGHRVKTILSMMNNVEGRTVDEDESILNSLIQLSNAFENALDLRDVFEDNKESILTIMAYISSGRAIRLYDWFDKNSKYKEFAEHLIDFASENSSEPVYAIFIERLRTFQKANLLFSIFSPERIEKIQKVLLNTVE